MNNVLTQTRPEIDYPQQDEAIEPGHYSFRIAASIATSVDISIDKGPWQTCRHSIGYWWYDWTGYDEGPHEAIVRTPEPNGRFLISAPRRFSVTPKG